MKIPFVVTLCLLLATSVSVAQMSEETGGFAVGPAFELSFPIKTLADKVGTGYGGSARLQYSPFRSVGIMATAGYVGWSDKGTPGISSKAHAIELLVGPNFGLGSGVHVGVEVGMYLGKETFSVSGVQSTETSKTEVMGGVFLGYEFSGIDVTAKLYPFESEYPNAMISIGYWFGL